MAIEVGTMVTVIASEFREKMSGIVGTVIDVVEPKTNGETGEEPLYRVEFFGSRHKLPPKVPMWWPAEDLKPED